ncbi:MAG TPA: class I SAM-dependent DNA methyltransferase, partial [Alicycliphilus sp.]|nr:class I SAM-dependent DNA methyltransferase [Alicycliphilus sp.]
MGDSHHASIAAAQAPATDNSAAHAFIARWRGSTASELATAQSFVIELCELLGVARPHPTPEQDYMFERPITFQHGDGGSSSGRIDCYKRGHFVLESKKLKAAATTRGFDDGLLRARSQGEGYARALPAAEGRPPFVIVVDVGNVIELYAEFSQSGATYTPFPDPRSHRLQLADLADPAIRTRLAAIWRDPHSLNPARISAQVTRQVADLLARLSQSLEASLQPKPNQASAPAHKTLAAPETVANYLTRCLFSMFAEDVELLPRGSFTQLLQRHRDEPATLQKMLAILWADMDRGGFCGALAKDVLHFNGKLFKGAGQDGYSLLLTPAQIALLTEAARCNWREVEPAIFGTLLERALDPTERHALGAHYTPRAYVERLVLPTVIAPLRAEWANAQAAALALTYEADTLEAAAPEVKTKSDFAALDRHNASVRAKRKEAVQQVQDFLQRLCSLRVLDPACGSANFLYVTLEHLKRLEGEVLNQLDALGHTQEGLGLGHETVTLQQLLGLELNQRAAALAELVLWIGWLQWHVRTRGLGSVAEPVVHNYGNIECRDAVLAWDGQEPAYDAAGRLLSRWDGRTFKNHPVTGESVPDEAAQVPQWRYVGARKADWPRADFIVGNPPFIGNKRMREALGDGYTQALRAAWPEVPESADFVMYWWQHAAAQVAAGTTQRMGLITTNSLTMLFNRRVVQAALDAGTHLDMAIADHPWVDSASGAAVRIAMTVLAAGPGEGQLLTVTDEQAGEHGEVVVTLAEHTGLVHADLAVGANVANLKTLQANKGLACPGVQLSGQGFILTPADAEAMRAAGSGALVKRYFTGRDLMQAMREQFVLDTFGFDANTLRDQHPNVYQWLLDRVKPERDLNPRESYRVQWWRHAETRSKFRAALQGLPRFIVTSRTARHRVFQFTDATSLPETKVLIVALADAYALGVLQSSTHITFANQTGGWLGVGNDSTYNHSECFEKFPFPSEDTGLTPELRARIAELAEKIDAHRKRVLGQDVGSFPLRGKAGMGAGTGAAPADGQAPTPTLPREGREPTPAPAMDLPTLTGLYNTLAALREGRALTAKEKAIHTQGLVGVLRELHDALDAAVLAAYGLPPGTTGDALLEALVRLNTQRAQQEAQGQILWLRPAFQNPQKLPQNQELPAPDAQAPEPGFADENSPQKQEQPAQQAWPTTLPAQVRAVADLLAA